MNMSRPVRGAWIEIYQPSISVSVIMSRPVRGAWIEIGTGCCGAWRGIVAPRKGRVD